MKVSMGFGLSGHDRFLIPFMLHAIQLDKWCDVVISIISLYATRVGRIVPQGLPPIGTAFATNPTYMA
jgi:hypothetical protein